MSYELVSHSVACPYCGETVDILIDTSIEQQNYIEDCSVCCRPMEINATCDGSVVNADARASD